MIGRAACLNNFSSAAFEEKSIFRESRVASVPTYNLMHYICDACWNIFVYLSDLSTKTMFITVVTDWLGWIFQTFWECLETWARFNCEKYQFLKQQFYLCERYLFHSKYIVLRWVSIHFITSSFLVIHQVFDVVEGFLVDTKFSMITTGNGCQNAAPFPVYEKTGFLRLCVDEDLVYLMKMRIFRYKPFQTSEYEVFDDPKVIWFLLDKPNGRKFCENSIAETNFLPVDLEKYFARFDERLSLFS